MADFIVGNDENAVKNAVKVIEGALLVIGAGSVAEWGARTTLSVNDTGTINIPSNPRFSHICYST